MIEVEVKVPVKNRILIEDALLQMGFAKGDLVKESDFYFDSSLHKLKDNDMALRVRMCENLTVGSTEHTMTFKGPKMDTISMTRKELEMNIEDTGIGKEILISLGYEPVPPVIKLRQHFHRKQITACLDQVERLGEFLELEIVVSQAQKKDAALNEILSLLQALEYKPEEIIRTSYLSMIQNKEENSDKKR